MFSVNIKYGIAINLYKELWTVFNWLLSIFFFYALFIKDYILCREVQQAQNLAYCLSLVVPTEKGTVKLLENFSCYRDQLLDSTVEKNILVYTNKVKKMGKNEAKVSIIILF